MSQSGSILVPVGEQQAAVAPPSTAEDRAHYDAKLRKELRSWAM